MIRGRPRVFHAGSLQIWAVTVLFCASAHLSAQALIPPPPPRYRVYLRYEIDLPAAQRKPRFQEFRRQWEALGFAKDEVEDPDEEFKDRTFVSMIGSIDSAKAEELLKLRPVQGILLYPSTYVLPKNDKEPVKVSVDIRTALDLQQRKMLLDQLRPFLQREGFKEYVGYDNRAQNRLVGTLPAGRLELVLQDLRKGEVQRGPLSFGWPIRRVEILPDPEGFDPIRPYIPLPVPPGTWATISPELSRVLPLPGEKTSPERIEVILATRPTETDTRYQDSIRTAAPDCVIEYRLGPVVAVRTGLENVARLAKLAEVRTIRLPRRSTPAILSAPAEAEAHLNALRAWSVRKLFEEGGLGGGVRAAVISDDFRGYKRFIRQGLPAITHFVDLTAETDANLAPSPQGDDPLNVGVGTYQALALALAAPRVQLYLVRIDGSAPYQLETVARYLGGEAPESLPLDERRTAIQIESRSLRTKREQLFLQRRDIFEAAREDDEGRRRREEWFAAQEKLDAEEKQLHEKMRRYLTLREDLRSLKDVSVVASTLTWADGYPVDGGSAVSRFLDDHYMGQCKAPLWVQAAGDTRGQSWSGLYRDVDGNGIMEFALPDSPLRPERWGHELNFLGWQSHSGLTYPTLLPLGGRKDAPRFVASTVGLLAAPFGQGPLAAPALAEAAALIPGTPTIRLVLQWREPRDPHLLQLGEGNYRVPLAKLGVTVFRQRDPSGTQLASDDLEIVARSAVRPRSEAPTLPDRVAQQIDQTTNSTVYEQVLDFKVDRTSRYAVWIEGRVNKSIRPKGEPGEVAELPLNDVSWELRPRLFVQVLEEDARAAGRPVWLDYATDEGTTGMPADAHAVVTVGAADARRGSRFYATLGSPFNVGLLPKPDIWVPDGLRLAPGGPPVTGTAVSSGLAAGVAASAISLEIPTDTIRYTWRGTGTRAWDLRALPARRP